MFYLNLVSIHFIQFSSKLNAKWDATKGIHTHMQTRQCCLWIWYQLSVFPKYVIQIAHDFWQWKLKPSGFLQKYTTL